MEKGQHLVRLSTGDTITATVSGEVASLHVERDDEVNAGDPLLEVVDFDNLEIKIKVDAYDVSAIKAGKEAEVTINALDHTFAGEITDISKQATVVGDLSYYTATLLPDDVEGTLPGMQVDVKVEARRADNVTIIPMTALSFDDHNQPYVTARDSIGNIQEVSVQTGINDGIDVTVLSGVRSGETMLIPSSVGSNQFMTGWLQWLTSPFRRGYRQLCGGQNLYRGSDGQ